MTEQKLTPEEASAALRESIGRLRQIAQAHAPAFVALAKGGPVDYLAPDRPGLRAVARLVGQILLADVQSRLLRSILIDEGVISQADFDSRLAEVVGKEALEYAVAINEGTAGLTGGFGFDEGGGA